MSQYIVFIGIALLLTVGAVFLSRVIFKQNARQRINSDAKLKLRQLNHLNKISLDTPLSELARPASLDDIIGQSKGIMALKAAICGPNPQHVIIYGPPGIGKTCAARLVLNAAKKSAFSPFSSTARLIEISASSLRSDERNIADPLLGSVHDPIYQGAGAYGLTGIPQPKAGAVTKAHGGILFIDEIGELCPSHLQRLLKVLEDRRVFFESSYYSSSDKNIPKYIHEIFKKGMPADFRLIGATTRSPKDLPAALRSRCVEIFFRPLLKSELLNIADIAAYKAGYKLSEKAGDLVGEYASSGRDAVNLVQLSAGIARENGQCTISENHLSLILDTGKYVKKPVIKLALPCIGVVNGLAISSCGSGTVIEIETVAIKSEQHSLKITGLVDEEELCSSSKRYRIKSSAKSSVENVLTALKKTYGLDQDYYYLHINAPGSVPIDGPSAGAAIAVSIYSAVNKMPVRDNTAVTGEISVNGYVRGVGGITAKVHAAKQAGANLVIVPAQNIEEASTVKGIEISAVSHLSELISICCYQQVYCPEETEIVCAKGI